MKCLMITFLVLFCLTFTACKKDKKNTLIDEQTTVVNCNLTDTTFNVELGTGVQYYAVLEDAARNIIVLGNATIAKYDYKGNLLWTKALTGSGTPQQIIQANGDNYFVVRSNTEFVQNPSGKYLFLTDYYKSATSLYRNCSIPYFRVVKYMGQAPDSFDFEQLPPINSSKCTLSKLDKNGNVLWNKVFDGNYFKGKVIRSSNDGNFYLLTHKLCGKYEKLLFNENGVFMDTVFYPFDKNKVAVHKINKDGNIIWSHTYNGILNNPSNGEVDVRPGITVYKNQIQVQTRHSLLILDANGIELSRLRPFGNDCSLWAWGLSASANGLYSVGHYYDSLVQYNRTYLHRVNESGVTVGSVFLPRNHGEPQVDAFGDAVIISGRKELVKYDLSGNTIWSRDFLSNNEFVSCTTPSCSEGMIFIYSAGTRSFLVKINKNGM
ncbi:MAG: hypothetical protein Q8M15_00110 [Bacteroidota bacterium]|nr:hypothetical protein [Bacteroidota bacterium]